MAERTYKQLRDRFFDNAKKAWYENGKILLEIQERKKWPKKFKTFEECIAEDFQISKRRGYQLIDAARFTLQIEHQKVNQNGILVHSETPRSERQIRPLSKLEDDAQRVHVWNKAVKAADEAGRKVTAEIVAEAVDTFLQDPIDVTPIIERPKRLVNATSNNAEVMYAPGSNDECYTPDYGVRAILPHLERFRGKTIWCPFDKADSNFVVILKENGFNVVHSHIDDGQDFYNCEPEQWDVIVSNPPFTNKRRIFERALSFGKPFALVMSNTWLNDSAPKQIFKKRGLQLLMFEERMKFLNQDNSENKITFSSSYFCCDFLKRDIELASLKDFGYGL